MVFSLLHLCRGHCTSNIFPCFLFVLNVILQPLKTRQTYCIWTRQNKYKERHGQDKGLRSKTDMRREYRWSSIAKIKCRKDTLKKSEGSYFTVGDVLHTHLLPPLLQKQVPELLVEGARIRQEASG